MTTALEFLILALVVCFIAAAILLFVLFDKKHKIETHCRCCGAALHKAGGCVVFPIGHGFCYKCATELYRSQNGNGA